MDTPAMSKVESPIAEDLTAGQRTEDFSLTTDWSPRDLRIDKHDAHCHMACSSAPFSKETSKNEASSTSRGMSGGATSVAADNFLGVSEGKNSGVNNFLGVGDDTNAALGTVSFLGLGESSVSGGEGTDDRVETASPDAGISSFFQSAHKDYQDPDSVFLGRGNNAFSPPDGLIATETERNASSDLDLFIEAGKNAESDLDCLAGAGKNALSDRYPLTGSGETAHAGTDNFLGVEHGGRTRQALDSLFRPGTTKNKHKLTQDSEPWVEVKIEIDVADDAEYVAAQANCHSSSSGRKNHQARKEKDPPESPGLRQKGQTSRPDSKFSSKRSRAGYGGGSAEQGDPPHRAERSDRGQLTNCDALSAGLPEAWQIKVEPESDDSAENPAAALGQEEAGRGRRSVRSDNYLVSSVSSTWSSFLAQHQMIYEDTSQNNSLTSSMADSLSLAKTADPNVADMNSDLPIKQEPMTELSDHVSDIERVVLAAGHSNAVDSSCFPNFVIKMEPESDQETIIDGMMGSSRENSASSTEEEDGTATKQQMSKKTRKRSRKPHPYQCQYCDVTFLKKSRLTEHTRTHTDERPYKCEECNISFRKAESLKVHTRTHTGELPFRCQECECAFKCSQELKRHTIRKHLAIRPFSCPECEARFFSKADLRGHRRVHSGEKPYKCSDCHAAFRKSSALTCHMRIHTGQKPYTCSECSRTFRRSDQLKRHMKLHTGEKPFQCSKCDAAFHCTSDLKKHCARKHSLVKPFSCPECGNKFYTNEDMKMHRIFHMGIKPHSCAECGAAFVRASDLKVHVRIHTGEKPYTCHLCNATFARSGDLRLHIRKHEGKRPFTCSICGLTFRRSGHLTRHMNTHNGQKSFGCEDCDAAFFTSSDLKRHASRVHKKDVTKFGCSECPARFFTSRALNIHLMKHSGGGVKPFPCSLCSAAFPHSDLLTSHMMDVHGTEEAKPNCKAEPVTETSDQYMYIDVGFAPADPSSISDNNRAETAAAPIPAE